MSFVIYWNKFHCSFVSKCSLLPFCTLHLFCLWLLPDSPSWALADFFFLLIMHEDSHLLNIKQMYSHPSTSVILLILLMYHLLTPSSSSLIMWPNKASLCTCRTVGNCWYWIDCHSSDWYLHSWSQFLIPGTKSLFLANLNLLHKKFCETAYITL